MTVQPEDGPFLRSDVSVGAINGPKVVPGDETGTEREDYKGVTVKGVNAPLARWRPDPPLDIRANDVVDGSGLWCPDMKKGVQGEGGEGW